MASNTVVARFNDFYLFFLRNVSFLYVPSQQKTTFCKKKWRKTSNADLAMAGAVCPPYRGSPPYAIFQHSKNRKILALQCAITQLLF